MTFKKISNGAIIEYNNGYTVKLRLEGDKLRIREELNGRPLSDNVFYLSAAQSAQLRELLKKANNADELMGALRTVFA